MDTASDDFPRWLDRLVALVIMGLIALCLFAPAAYPQQFKPDTGNQASRMEEPPGYLGISHRSCLIERTLDNQGTLNGFRLRVKLSYDTPDHLEWDRVLGMYRLEDEKRAHLDCLDWQRQVFNRIWDARGKERARVAKSDADALRKLPRKLALRGDPAVPLEPKP